LELAHASSSFPTESDLPAARPAERRPVTVSSSPAQCDSRGPVWDRDAVPDIDVVDSTWICTRPGALATLMADPANWRRWWPELSLRVEEWRGPKGMRWRVGPSERGTVAGSMEVWLEPQLDGVVAHFFLRLDATNGRPLSRRRIQRLTERYRRRAKELFWSLGHQLDPARMGRVSGGRQVASSE
jgi:hypothetical protein